MTISAALQSRGKHSPTWSTLLVHNFLDLKRKKQSRAVGGSCSVPYLGRVVDSSPHSHLHTREKHTLMPIFMDIGDLNATMSSPHMTSQSRGVSDYSEDISTEDSSEPHVNHSKHYVNGSAQIVHISSPTVNTDFSTKKKRVAWNKGQHCSKETKEKIRARTRQAMEDPKVRERLRKAREGTTQSSETKLKIKNGLLNFWEMKRELKKMRESCLREWEEWIADTARRGSDGDVVYQWDSYNVLMMELVNSRKRIRVRKAKTGKKSADHRRKISEAIKAKWADPDYGKRVRRGLSIYSSTRSSIQSSVPSPPEGYWSNWETQTTGMVETKKPSMHAAAMNNSSDSYYKDPMAHQKLEKLKLMRSSRHFDEDRKQRVIMKRAWVLMAQAKRAADTLEAAKVKDENAVASLMEARKLLAEAERLFKNAGLSADWAKTTCLEADFVKGATGSEFSKAYRALNQSAFASHK